MKKNLVFFWAIGAGVLGALSGTLPMDPRTYALLLVHERGSASGCVLRLSNSVYLVTAKHALFSSAEGTNAPVLLSETTSVLAYSNTGTTNVSKRAFILGLRQLL